MDAKNNLREELRNMYMSLHPVIPDKVLSELVITISKSIKNIFTSAYGYKNNVTLVFSCSSLETDAKKFTLSSCNDREFIFINLLKVEFFRDYLAYKSYGDEQAFQWFFSKYMRYIEFNSFNMDAATFNNYLYSRACNERDYVNEPYFKAVVVDIMFLILHEWCHKQDDILKDACFFIEDVVKKCNLPDISKGIITEAACDFIALDFLVRRDKPLFGLTNTEVYGVSFLAVLLLHYYNLFPEITVRVLNGEDSIFKEKIETIVEQLQTRLSILACALAGTEKYRTTPSKTFVHDLLSNIDGFKMVFIHTIQFFNEIRPSALTSYLEMPEEEKNIYKMEENKEAWVYII